MKHLPLVLLVVGVLTGLLIIHVDRKPPRDYHKEMESTQQKVDYNQLTYEKFESLDTSDLLCQAKACEIFGTGSTLVSKSGDVEVRRFGTEDRCVILVIKNGQVVSKEQKGLK